MKALLERFDRQGDGGARGGGLGHRRTAADDAVAVRVEHLDLGRDVGIHGDERDRELVLTHRRGATHRRVGLPDLGVGARRRGESDEACEDDGDGRKEAHGPSLARSGEKRRTAEEVGDLTSNCHMSSHQFEQGVMFMKRALALLFGATMIVATFGVVSANADPGPNGNNDKGLCTAYFNGQKNGHDKNDDGRSDPKPFANLENTADPEEDDLVGEELASAVYEWCRTMAGDGGVEIGGQPNDNGRWTCSQSGDEYSCTENDAKGGKPSA